MKKSILSMSALLAAVLLTSSAFAANTSIIDTTSTTIGGGLFKVSKGVTLKATANTAAYSALAAHAQGDKEYGTKSTDPKIFSKTKATGNITSDCSTADFDFTATGWSAQ